MTASDEGTCPNPDNLEVELYERRNGDHGVVFKKSGKTLFRHTVHWVVRTPLHHSLPAAYEAYEAYEAHKKRQEKKNAPR